MVAKLSQYFCSNLGVLSEDYIRGADINLFLPAVVCVFTHRFGPEKVRKRERYAWERYAREIIRRKERERKKKKGGGGGGRRGKREHRKGEKEEGEISGKQSYSLLAFHLLLHSSVVPFGIVNAFHPETTVITQVGFIAYCNKNTHPGKPAVSK